MKGPLDQGFQSSLLVSNCVTFDTPDEATVRTGKVEIGQGILTALRQMAAEELRLSPGRIRLLSGQTDATPNEGYTAGSLSVVSSGGAIRLACAQARTMMIERFASRVGCLPSAVTVEEGLLCSPSGLVSSYWNEYRGEDFRVAIRDVSLTPSKDFKWIGQSLPRADLLSKLSGGAFIHDLNFPDMIHAHAIRGHASDEIDHHELRKLQSKYVAEASFLSVGKFLAVYSGSEATTRRISEVARQILFPDSARAQYAVDPAEYPSRPSLTTVLEAPGNTSPRNSARQIRASYSRPYLSHGSIGPSCALAHFDGKTLRVWTHSQGVFPLRAALATVLGIEEPNVVVHHVHGAGCYGHNGADDVACDAAVVAFHTPRRHVRVQWTRRDELRTAPYGPASLVQIEAGIDKDGRPTSWHVEIWSPTHIQRPGSRGAPGLLGGEEVNFEANKMPPGDVPLERGGGATRNGFALYRLPAQKLTHHLIEDAGVRTSALRGLGAHANVFAIESFIDELAIAASVDPLDYRLSLLDDERAKAVLLKVAEMASWSSRPQSADGSGLGIAFSRYKNIAAYAAVIAKVDIDEHVSVRNVWCCVDAGLIVNPNGVLSQIEGGIVQATSWTIKESIPTNTSELPRRWEEYPILQFSEVPEVMVEIISSPEEGPLGVGEVAVGPTSAAIGNAVAAALGQRIRKLPFVRDQLEKLLLEADDDE